MEGKNPLGVRLVYPKELFRSRGGLNQSPWSRFWSGDMFPDDNPPDFEVTPQSIAEADSNEKSAWHRFWHGQMFTDDN